MNRKYNLVKDDKMNSNNTKMSVIEGIDAPAEKTPTFIPVFKSIPGQSLRGEPKGDLDLWTTLAKKDSPKTGRIQRVFYFRLAQGLMQKIGLEEGKPLLMCYDKEDQKSMMLFSHPQGYLLKGENLSKKSPTKMYKITVPSNWCVLDPFGTTKIAYHIDDQKRIIFRLK